MVPTVSYPALQKYLDSYLNYEKKNIYSYHKAFKLERVRACFKRCRIAYQKLNVIHVAGTKGKGSTATFIAHILAHSGYRVGLYTSPHFDDVRERIAVVSSQRGMTTKDLISKKDIMRIVSRLKIHFEAMRTSSLGALTFFEVYTAVAFQYFLEQKLDYVVLETGLGGALDATNIVSPLLSVITHIGYDHTDKLGSTLKEIALQKAGIIKKGVPVVSTPQRTEALTVIKKRSFELKSPLYVLGKDFMFSHVLLQENYTSFDFTYADCAFRGLTIGLKGRHQVENASVALAALCILKDRSCCNKPIAFREGLAAASLKGRLEIIQKEPLVVLDIAHNVSSFRALRDALASYFPRKKIILVFAASKDKDIRGMLATIKYDKIVLTRFDSVRAHAPDDIKERCHLARSTKSAPTVKEALAIAYGYYTHEHIIVVAGSFFLVASLRKLF